MVAMFDQIGLGQWFRFVTGTVEVGAALALPLPRYREARQRFAAQQAGTKAWPLQKWQETSELDHPVWKNGGQFLGSSM